jgi:polar amino acid transport system permease protein
MDSFFSLIARYRVALWDGALTSIELAAISWIGGLVLGVLLGTWRAGHNRRTGTGVNLLSMAASSVPVMVYLLWCHYPLQARFRVNVNPFITAAVVFTLYNALAIGEIVRGSIDGLPVSFSMAARATGVPRSIYTRHVLVPLALRAALPSYLGSQVAVLHMTLFASLISVNELFRVTQQINAVEYNAVSVFSLLALFYFVLSFPLLVLARVANRHLARLGLER